MGNVVQVHMAAISQIEVLRGHPFDQIGRELLNRTSPSKSPMRLSLSSDNRQDVLSLLDPGGVIFERGGAERSRNEYPSQHIDGDIPERGKP